MSLKKYLFISLKSTYLVEKANGIMREELIDNIELFKNIDIIGEFNLLLEEFNRNYNCYRPHSSIDYSTPMGYYERCKKMR